MNMTRLILNSHTDIILQPQRKIEDLLQFHPSMPEAAEIRIHTDPKIEQIVKYLYVKSRKWQCAKLPSCAGECLQVSLFH